MDGNESSIETFEIESEIICALPQMKVNVINELEPERSQALFSNGRKSNA